MKKLHYGILAGVSFLIILGAIYTLWVIKENTASEKSLSEIQEVFSTSEQEQRKKEISLSLEKQKQLNQIGEIYTLHEQEHHSTLATILWKYKSNYTPSDIEIIRSLVELHDSEDTFKKELQEKLGINFLPSDIRSLFASKEKLANEKQLELTRLELFQEKNEADIENNTRKVIGLTLEVQLKKEGSLSEVQVQNIVSQVITECFEKNNILNPTLFSSLEKQQIFLSTTIESVLTQNTGITRTLRQNFITSFLKDISELGILFPPEEAKKQDTLSFLSPIKKLFQQGEYFVFTAVEASEEVPLTSAERQILLLKTQVLIDKIIQESIKTEIEYNQWIHTLAEYNTLVNQHLVELEELIILKTSLENDTSIITLDDIQRFNLWNYVDDSVAIQSLTAVSYVQEKSWHIIIYNLNGSAKLGEENMLLYPWYGIETLENATVTIVFSDESILRLDPLSRVNITTPSPTNVTVEVEHGNIWTRVLKPLLTGDTFTIDAGDISLGVRGTSLSLSRGSTDTSVHIVDSYTSDGSPSVTMTEKSSWNTSPIAKGKKINVDSSKNIITTNESRSTLFTQNPQIGEFLKEDLNYLSLLIDDRNRGFYNNPLSGKNDSENFFKKISGELQVSLPQEIEKKFILKNTELHSQAVNTWSIYHLLSKDSLITAIKANPVGNVNTKIQSVVSLDMQGLETDLQNKRAIEKRFDYNITQDIVLRNTFTPNELKDIFLDFPIIPAENNEKTLEEAKKNLEINNGSNIVSQDISPLPYYSPGWVMITWKSSNTGVLSDAGILNMPLSTTDLIFTATLKLWNLSTTKDFALIVVPKQLTTLEKLEKAANMLQTHLYAISPFASQIDIAPSIFIEMEVITWVGLKLNWVSDGVVLDTQGNINQPSFNQWNSNNYTVEGTLSYGGENYTRSYTLPTIQAEDCSGKIIGDECYELVASAEYNTPGDIELRNPTGTIIPRPLSAGINLSTCDTTGNCAWSNTGKIETMYGYSASKILGFNKLKSWIKYDGESGILVDNVASADYLPYDLSSLNLWNNWAIEMSVRGEDLKKNSVHYLFASPSVTWWNFAVNMDYKKLRFIYSGVVVPNETDTSSIGNKYYKVFFNPTAHYIEWFWSGQNNNTGAILSNTIKIGSNKDNNYQWNGIINYFRIYKKE